MLLFLFSFDELHLCKFIIIVFVFHQKKHSQNEQMWKSQQKWNRFTCSIHYQIMEPTNKQTNKPHARTHTHIFFPGTSPISMIEELKENYFLSKQTKKLKNPFQFIFFAKKIICLSIEWNVFFVCLLNVSLLTIIIVIIIINMAILNIVFVCVSK